MTSGVSIEDNDIFLSEIISYGINDTSPWDDERIWTFDRKARLIHCFTACEQDGYCENTRDGSVSPDPHNYAAKFAIGDIVLIAPFPWNKESPTSENVIGVIGQMPIPFDEWVSWGNDKSEWDDTYVIYRILGGYLQHIHVRERGIQPYKDILPDNLMFLKDLSDQFRGKRILREEALEKVLEGKIFVEKVRYLRPADYTTEWGKL